MRNVLSTLFLLSLVTSCFPQAESPNQTQTQTPTVVPSATPTSRPSVLPSLTPQEVDETIQQILTSQNLALQVNEELMLIGSLKLSSGRTVSFDDLAALLRIENKNPDLLQLDVQNRLIKALQSGDATVVISVAQNPNVQVPVTVKITPPPAEVGPNEALLDLEIQ